MLTIKTPLTLVCGRTIALSCEPFCKRITGNYEVMASGITGEDLLHVTTAPPEIYLGEGGMTSLVNNTQINSRQETKLEVINNLLNRIVLNEDVNLTYQDRVYITDVLHKLGIRNTQQFMNQVSRLKQETNHAEQLVSLYWNHLQELTERTEEYRNLRKEERQITEENTQENVRLHLHEDILNRLQTGAIYQILHNFYSGYGGDSLYVYGPEIRLAEQGRTAGQILLNRLQTIVEGETVPLTYRHDNYYETMDIEETERGGDSVSSQITSAVLLGLIDNLYYSRFEKLQNMQESYLRMENALYQSAENTIWRMQAGAAGIWNVQNRRETGVYEQRRYERTLAYVYRLLETEEDGGEETPFWEPPRQEAQEREAPPGGGERGRLPEAGEIPPAQTIPADLPDTERLEEELEEINRQNIENYRRYQEFLTQRKERREDEGGRPSRERMRRESLIALTQPQAFLEEIREEARERETRPSRELAEITKLLPQRTRELYERLEQYEIHPEQFTESREISRNNIGLLLHDIQSVEEARGRETERRLTEQEREQVREVSQTVLERWKESAPREAAQGRFLQSEAQDVHLIHRLQEREVNEELLEQLMEQNRLQSRSTQVNRTEEITTQTVNQTLERRQIQNQSLVQETENLSELIQEGVQRQVNALSEQVYHKLEKRLQNEKRRRGY